MVITYLERISEDYMIVKLFEFSITDFEEVYAVLDNERQRLHVSPVNYSFNLTLKLTRDLKEEIEQKTKYLELNFKNKLQQILTEIIAELDLA